MISGDSGSSNFDITQKLQLLTIHFPKLRLVWSPSPYATAQLFDELKQGKPEPDPTQAAGVGSDETTKELDNIVDKLNTNIYDFLLKLPGITTRNIAKVMTTVKNLRELIKLDVVSKLNAIKYRGRFCKTANRFFFSLFEGTIEGIAC